MDVPHRLPAQAVISRQRFSGRDIRPLTLVALLAATATAGAGPPQFLESHRGCLVTDTGGVEVELEHATTTEQRRFGLMERTTLPDSAGMLFTYEAERAPTAGFWMYRTRIPLDIAWLDESGDILALDTMSPCDTDHARDCPSWSPGVAHSQVLEMSADFFEAHDVGVGDRLVANLNDNRSCPPVD